MDNSHNFRSGLEWLLTELSGYGLEKEDREDALQMFQEAVRGINAAMQPRSTTVAMDHTTAKEMEGVELKIGGRMYAAGRAHDLFVRFDIKSRNFLQAWELQHGLETLGVSLSNDDCEYLVDKYGSRGRLNYTQFINMYENVTTQRETAYNAAYSGTLVDAPTPRMAATFEYQPSEAERLDNLKAKVRDKIYQVFGSASRAFLDFDTADNSIVSIGELAAGLREYVPFGKLMAPFARAHRNQLTLTEFNKFCSSKYLPSGPTRKAATDRIGSPGLNTPRHVGRGAAASGRGAPSPSTTTPRYTSTPRRGGNPRSRTPPIDGRELFRSAHLRNTTATPRSMASSMSTPYSRGSSSGGIGSGARAASPYHATPPGPPASAVPGWVRTGGSPPPTPPSGAMPPPIPSNMPSGASDVDVHAVLVKVNDALYQHHGSIRNTFMKMRSSKAGVSASDMKTGLHRIGCNISMANAMALVQKYGRNGRISLHDFLHMLGTVSQ